MPRYLLPLIALVSVLSALPATAQTALPDSLRIVVLGSSTAAGAGPSVKDSAWVWRYRAYLESIDPDYEVVNLAVGGFTTYHIQPDDYVSPEGRVSRDTLHNISRAIALDADAVIINLPSNDAAKNYSIIEQSQNFERVAALADSAGIPLWVCTTQPRNLTDTLRMNLITMKDWIIDRFGDHTLDFWTALAVEDGSMHSEYNSGDGVHLNDAAHGLLFARVRDADIPGKLGGTSTVTPAPLASFHEISAYPHPVQDRLSVRIRTQIPAQCTLLLTDLLGRQLRRTDFHSEGTVPTTQHLQLADLPGGVYHLVLRTGNHITATSILHVQ
jgi:lysophospholipase L1-like esterase